MREYGEHELDEAWGAWREQTHDPDAPASFWSDDDYMANYSRTDRLEDLGHA